MNASSSIQWRLFTAAAVFGLASLLAAGSEPTGASSDPAPWSPGAPSMPQADTQGVACGLVETTWDDPNWIMVTSDHILRDDDCVAECAGSPTAWYNRPFSPCYPTNRYWKFEENSGTAFAFTMEALGVGSYDGMYLRRNVRFQLYRGGDESNPFGPERRGPAYLSIDFWRDVFPACEGFAPNTIFVTGGAGALSQYSIKIGGDTSVLDVDLKESDNEKEHHTDAFTDDYVLRRGSFFKVEVRLGEEYGHGCHEVYFQLLHDFEGSETTIEIPPVDAPPQPDQWGAEWIETKTNADESRTVTLHVHIPAGAPVGRYTLSKAFVRNRGKVDPTDDHPLDKPLNILFNPWKNTDAVYLANDTDRNEYVLNQTGRLWQGSKDSNAPISWRYDQFNKKSLELVWKLLKSLKSADRSSPSTVARFLSKMANSQDDNGVLEGRWSGDYSGGTSPTFWSGSDQIIRQYLSSSSPVKYGQCWVFGGILTTFLRSVGVPCRPLSNFESAHDKDQPSNLTVDRYWDVTGRYDRARSRDSVWNFHVWCDAWIGGWAAVDATPQERSGGAYQLGPAPLSAVKAKSGGAFDVDFVTAEVDADIKNWRSQSDGTDRLVSTDTVQVGQRITTKAVGGSGASIISSDYKTPEAGGDQRTASADSRGDPADLSLEFDFPESVALSADILWTTRITNPTAAKKTVHLLIEGSAVTYNGEYLGAIDAIDTTFELDPAAAREVTLPITVSKYLEWTPLTRTFEATFSMSVVESGQLVLQVFRTTLSYPLPILAVESTDNGPVLTIQWRNPLPSALSQVQVLIAGGDHIAFQGETEVTREIGTVLGAAELSLREPFRSLKAGSHVLTAHIVSAELAGVSGFLEFESFSDCNANGIPDAEDIASGAALDCNANGVPDACEPDCNANGIPDDCEISSTPTLDCNGNNVPDSCDIARGTSLDRNKNGRPDECDPDCNDNNVPDDIDISSGVSSDFNRNGVPDECDDDCNENGIPDELDVSIGTSTDLNLNGVPDECEVVTPNESPVALCRDVVVVADSNGTANADINAGSFDPEGSAITLTQTPPGPYLIGTTTVKLTVRDDRGASAECSSKVTVQAKSSPRAIGPGDAGFDRRRIGR